MLEEGFHVRPLGVSFLDQLIEVAPQLFEFRLDLLFGSRHNPIYTSPLLTVIVSM